jgi:hypothetical protein
MNLVDPMSSIPLIQHYVLCNVAFESGAGGNQQWPVEMPPASIDVQHPREFTVFPHRQVRQEQETGKLVLLGSGSWMTTEPSAESTVESLLNRSVHLSNDSLIASRKPPECNVDVKGCASFDESIQDPSLTRVYPDMWLKHR